MANKATSDLEIIETHDAYTPLVGTLPALILDNTHVPLVVIDVWEHVFSFANTKAYYIDKRNDRAAYIADWFKLVNWEFAASQLASVSKL